MKMSNIDNSPNNNNNNNTFTWHYNQASHNSSLPFQQNGSHSNLTTTESTHHTMSKTDGTNALHHPSPNTQNSTKTTITTTPEYDTLTDRVSTNSTHYDTGNDSDHPNGNNPLLTDSYGFDTTAEFSVNSTNKTSSWNQSLLVAGESSTVGYYGNASNGRDDNGSHVFIHKNQDDLIPGDTVRGYLEDINNSDTDNSGTTTNNTMLYTPLATTTADSETTAYIDDVISASRNVTTIRNDITMSAYRNEPSTWVDNNTTDISIPSTELFSIMDTTANVSSFNHDIDIGDGVDYWKESGSNFTNGSSFFDINDSSILFTSRILDDSSPFSNGNTRIDSSPETITKVFILALVSIFGSIGNFLVVGSVIKNRHLHRPPFYFLLSMGVTDMARGGFCLPVVMATALQGSIWRHGDTACKMFAFAASFFVFSSTLSLLVIAVERHMSIVHAKAYRRRCHGFINLIATIFIWVTAFCISFPPIFASLGAGEYIFISEEAQCTYQHKHFSHNDGLNSVLTFIGVTSLTLFLYYRIFVFMRSHRRMRPLQHRPAFSSTWTFVGPGANGQAFINWLNGFGGHTSNSYRRPTAAVAATSSPSGGQQQQQQQQHHQRCTQRLNFGRVVNLSTSKNEHLTRLFLIMTLVHGSTWLPYVILSLWRIFINSSNIPAGFVTYAAWLSYSQVAICPLAYFITRGRSRNTSRIIQMEPTERNEFLLENKIPK